MLSAPLFSVLIACGPGKIDGDLSGTTAGLEDTDSQSTVPGSTETDDSTGEDTGTPPGDTDTTVEESTDDTTDFVPEVDHPLDPPPLPRYSLGACPELIGGPTNDAGLNTDFPTGDTTRQFRLLVPEGYDGSEPVPLVFAWHWINASSSSFVREGEMESAVDQLGFIAVFPDSTGDFLFDWPFFETWAAEPDLLYFEDLLACVTEQYNVDPYQIHGLGVSAGALWLTYLTGLEQSDYFASVMTLSGGLADAYGYWEMDWAPRERKFPAYVLDGGPTDWLGINFYEATNRYRDELVADDHFVVFCEHDDGHAMPPMTPPKEDYTTFYALWQFFLDHPYDLPAGYSPYLETGLPDYYPDWCEFGN